MLEKLGRIRLIHIVLGVLLLVACFRWFLPERFLSSEVPMNCAP